MEESWLGKLTFSWKGKRVQRILLLAALLGIITLAACGNAPYHVASPASRNHVISSVLLRGSSSGDWPMFGYGIGHTGYVDQPVFPHEIQGKLLWSQQPGPIFSSPAAALDMLYISSADGYLYALAQSTGLMVWRAHLGNHLTDATPALEGQILFVAMHSSALAAFNALTGQLYWTFDTGEKIQAPPLVAGGRVLFASRTTLWVLDAASVYIATWHGNIFALDRVHGTLRWTYALNTQHDQSVIDGVGGSMALANGRLYVGDYRGSVLCIDAARGKLLWRYATGAQILATPVVTWGRVYVGSGDGYFYALDARTGRPAWRYHTGEVRASASLANGHLYVGSLDGVVYAFA